MFSRQVQHSSRKVRHSWQQVEVVPICQDADVRISRPARSDAITAEKIFAMPCLTIHGSFAQYRLLMNVVLVGRGEGGGKKHSYLLTYGRHKERVSRDSSGGRLAGRFSSDQNTYVPSGRPADNFAELSAFAKSGSASYCGALELRAAGRRFNQLYSGDERNWEAAAVFVSGWKVRAVKTQRSPLSKTQRCEILKFKAFGGGD
jgi:hypothetical protein